jgi:hypothetical protein
VVAISIMTMAAVSIRRDAIAITLYIGAGILAAALAIILANASTQDETAP